MPPFSSPFSFLLPSCLAYKGRGREGGWNGKREKHNFIFPPYFIPSFSISSRMPGLNFSLPSSICCGRGKEKGRRREKPSPIRRIPKKNLVPNSSDPPPPPSLEDQGHDGDAYLYTPTVRPTTLPLLPPPFLHGTFSQLSNMARETEIKERRKGRNSLASAKLDGACLFRNGREMGAKDNSHLVVSSFETSSCSSIVV